MKTFSLLLLFAIFTVGSSCGKDKASPHTTTKGDLVSVTYGQPSKKGRVIFGGLVPYDQVWRTGADEATEITFNVPCTFAGKPVKKGTYTLFTIPGKNEWTVILNSKLGQWGSFDYDNVKTKNVLEAKVAAKNLDSEVEKMNFSVNKEGVTLSWDKTSVFFDVKAMK